MGGAKAGRLDENIRVDFGLVGKTDSRSRQFVYIDAAKPNLAVMIAEKQQDPALCETELRHSLFHANGQTAHHRNCRA